VIDTKNRWIPILFAFLAAVFYAINTPLSKLLLDKVSATFMASFLYLGAGVQRERGRALLVYGFLPLPWSRSVCRHHVFISLA